MRAVDAIEKITRDKPQYLSKHAKQIFRLRHVATTKELKWHLALLIPRLVLNKEKLDLACQILTMWALDNTNSHIVRVNSLQGLYELSTRYKTAINDFMTVLAELEKENIPSVNARIRILKKHMRS
jgi:hypothetical protein